MIMNQNPLSSQQAPVVGVVHPVSDDGSNPTDWIDMSDFKRLMAVIQVGAFGASATLNAKLEQATDGSGSDAKDIEGKEIAELTDADDDDDSIAIINLDENELDVDGGFTHVRLTITAATANTVLSGLVFGFGARYQPAADVAAVVEVVE